MAVRLQLQVAAQGIRVTGTTGAAGHTEVLNTLGITRGSGATAGRSAGACVAWRTEQDHRQEAAEPRVRGVAGRRPVVGQMTDEREGYRR